MVEAPEVILKLLVTLSDVVARVLEIRVTLAFFSSVKVVNSVSCSSVVCSVVVTVEVTLS